MLDKYLNDKERPTELSWEDENPANYHLNTGILREFEKVKAEYERRKKNTTESTNKSSKSDYHK